jgi:hypothetical protein
MRIFDFAVVANWDQRLDALANDMAEPERWTFLRVPSGSRLPILDSYMRYTFMRLAEENKIAQTERTAAFNTGLLTPGQEEIFGVFSVADRFDPTRPLSPENKKWFLKSWSRSGDHQLTEIASVLASLPPLASYWTDPAELVFNPALHVELNVDHIIRDNLSRFPEELGGHLDRDGVPTDIRLEPGGDEDGSEEEHASPAPVQSIPLATRNALEGAMKHSVRLAQRSYRIAVPQYYRGRIQLLLPLYLRDTSRADLALTIEKHGEWYRASTVLYPDWAYRHARLLTRPNSEWLGGFRTDLRAT